MCMHTDITDHLLFILLATIQPVWFLLKVVTMIKTYYCNMIFKCAMSFPQRSGKFVGCLSFTQRNRLVNDLCRW